MRPPNRAGLSFIDAGGALVYVAGASRERKEAFVTRCGRFVEPGGRTGYNPGVRTWHCLLRIPGCVSPRQRRFRMSGRAIRGSCSPDNVRAFKEAMNGYWHCQMVQPDEGLWIHSTQGRRQRRSSISLLSNVPDERYARACEE